MPKPTVIDVVEAPPDSSIAHFDPNDRQYRVCCCCHAQSVARCLSVLFIAGLLAVLPYTLNHVLWPLSPLPVVLVIILVVAVFGRNRYCLGFVVGVLALLLTALMVVLFLLTSIMLWTCKGLMKEMITDEKREEIILFLGLVIITAAAALIVFWIFLVFDSFFRFVRDMHRAAKLPCIVERPTTSINRQVPVNEEFRAHALGHLEDAWETQKLNEMYPVAHTDSAYSPSSDDSVPARGPSAPPVPLYPMLNQGPRPELYPMLNTGANGVYGW